MAKLAVIFFFTLILVQYAAAGVTKRDAPETTADSETQKNIENAVAQMQEFLKNAFSKENVDKLTENLQKFGETLSAKGKELIEQANAGVEKLKESH